MGNHTIRIESKDGDTINIDALAYSESEYDPSNVSAPFNPYYLFILLGIVVAGVAVCAVLDYKAKHKKKVGKDVAPQDGSGRTEECSGTEEAGEDKKRNS